MIRTSVANKSTVLDFMETAIGRYYKHKKKQIYDVHYWKQYSDFIGRKKLK